MLALTSGGCSFSYQLDSLFPAAKSETVEYTGSITPVSADPQSELPIGGDLALTRAAVRDVLSKGRDDASVPWENPTTGARGTVTPIAKSYQEAGLTCRDFLASYVRGGSEAWMQGEACRADRGSWEVRNLKPWRRS
ncbi:MAG TPA: RT0821/Lpp0805 family surface protein [Xanthobacteraceae bacterium]|nr:RT0821/Lpp0805 family surface protein [Xanthobacteraceae bacterium]